mmetsp:Transcript_15963/g.27972  ORF Transcript_15963/g.27972 Transcript_15963/m.27972 type:complete len:287 (-) Transcript_15963:769-1629(-)
MASSGQILCRCAILNRKYSLCNQLTRILTDHMHTENSVRLGIAEDLDQALGGLACRINSLGSRIRQERKYALLVLHTLSLQSFFRFAHIGHFRLGVYHTWNGIVIYVRLWTARNKLDACNTLVFGLVRKHRSLDNITNGKDVGHVGAEAMVDIDSALVVCLDTHILQAELGSVWHSANRHEHIICGQGGCISPRRILKTERHIGVRRLGRGDLGLELKVHTLLLQNPQKVGGQLRIQARANAIHKFDNGHFSTQSSPHGSQLQSDDTTTDDDHLLWDLWQGQRTCG